MSVFTKISKQQAGDLLKNYCLGDFKTLTPIEAGVTNSNYFLETSEKKLILTIFEELQSDELAFFFDLTQYLAKNSIPCPSTYQDKQGDRLQLFKNKPLALIECLPGKTIEHPTPQQCFAVGEILARLHLASLTFQPSKQNSRGHQWHQQTSNAILPSLSNDDAQLLKQELHFQSQQNYSQLPAGIIHADLFPDNVLFQGKQLTGLIDFYYACSGYFAYDLAVTYNAWCRVESGSLKTEHAEKLLDGYQQVRALTEVEHKAWAALLRAAALRFWLSRLTDELQQTDNPLIQVKNPNEFKKILLACYEK